MTISLFLRASFKLCIYLWTRGHTNNFNSSLESIKPPNSDGWHVSCRLISSQTDQEKLRPDLRCLSGFCCLLNFTIVDVSCEERVFFMARFLINSFLSCVYVWANNFYVELLDFVWRHRLFQNQGDFLPIIKLVGFYGDALETHWNGRQRPSGPRLSLVSHL